MAGAKAEAMTLLDFFVKPAIQQLSGQLNSPQLPAPYVIANLTRNINSAPGRRDVVRVKIIKEDDGLVAVPILGKSGSISTLSRSNGYFLIEEDSQGVTENSVIKVYLFQ